jgi:hypothetical protein
LVEGVREGRYHGLDPFMIFVDQRWCGSPLPMRPYRRSRRSLVIAFGMSRRPRCRTSLGSDVKLAEIAVMKLETRTKL